MATARTCEVQGDVGAAALPVTIGSREPVTGETLPIIGR